MAFNETQRKVLQYLAQPERSEAGDVMERLQHWNFFDVGSTEVTSRGQLEAFLDSINRNEDFCSEGIKRARKAFDIWPVKKFKVGDKIVPSENILPIGSVVIGINHPEYSYLKVSDVYYVSSDDVRYKEIVFASNYKIVYLPESYTKESK